MTKRVLITGVSSGIGLAQARLFIEKDYQVYGVDQGENPLLEGDFHFLQRDLTLDLEPIFDWCPQVDVLCNTAGVLDDYKPLLEQTAQEIQEIFEINYVTPVELTRHYLTQMLENKKFTCYDGVEESIKSGNYLKETVVTDGKLITSRGPSTALAFAYAIVEKLGGDADSLRQGMLYTDVFGK